MIQFDSQEEKLLFQQYPGILEASQNEFFPKNFKDSNGHTFRAKLDFTYKAKIFIEYKSHQLNNSRTQDHARKLYDQQLTYVQSTHFLKLRVAWNHSRFKQGIIARAYPGRFLLVFKDGTELSTQAVNGMDHENIRWCYEARMAWNLEEMVAALTLH